MEIPENEISLLRRQIQALEAKKFDLEAWKASTLLFVSRIFGVSSEHVRQVRDLKYDYSSWSLRDTSGGNYQTDPVRTRAKEILEAAVAELQMFGQPSPSLSASGIMEVVQKELTGKQLEELKNILSLPDKEKHEKLRAFLSSLDKDLLVSLLIELFNNTPQ
jgi:hypothetical protein